MPELPEVETIVRQLKSQLAGRLIEDVEIFWLKSVVGPADLFGSNITGRRIDDVFRRGKYICWRLDNHWHLTIHLKMTGKLLFQLPQKDKSHVRLRFVFREGVPLFFIDSRKFGRVKLWPDSLPVLPKLGKDPLSAVEVRNTLKMIKSSRPLKSLLLDQSFLAGIGNIYADEALHEAKIHPLRRIPELNPARLALLSRVIPSVLTRAINNQGTTLINYRQVDDSKGNHQYYLKVYGRQGLPCYACARTIEKMIINGRSSYFCPRCQKYSGHV